MIIYLCMARWKLFFLRRTIGHICDRSTKIINPEICYIHGILPIENDKYKDKPLWDLDDKFKCHDRQVRSS